MISSSLHADRAGGPGRGAATSTEFVSTPGAAFFFGGAREKASALFIFIFEFGFKFFLVPDRSPSFGVERLESGSVLPGQLKKKN